MYRLIFFILFFVLVASKSSYGQLRDSIHSGVIYVPQKIIRGDTVPHVYIDEIKVVTPWVFKNKREQRRYGRLVINIKKTLPYARLARNKIDEIAASLDTIKGEKHRKQFVKQSEKELFNEFEQPLKKLTYSQGRMLIKLIDRETGDTSYQLIKELKGGFSAFMWQSVARIFGSNLKAEYNSKGSEAMVEHIILMIDNGLL
ncbi:protein of unknown function [Saccharicrinis carchari]|uniref:DUF4294 domain-containing protein n=1 Tax=Saccharicrinis carchari TaxID=1168039 RepID=A0A521BAT8_SACCC|nr:DUF4294 domain-containing protein [Saccharicrinis carchari]SMO44111.1 protein of unknown function [Saccharicrinis carchari]